MKNVYAVLWSVIVTLLVSFWMVYAWSGLTASNGDALDYTKWNELVDKVSNVYSSGNNIWIGVNNPQYGLHVGGVWMFGSESVSYNSGTNPNNAVIIEAGILDPWIAGGMITPVSNGNNHRFLELRALNAWVPVDNHLVLSKDGNVWIWVLDPYAKLTVDGYIGISRLIDFWHTTDVTKSWQIGEIGGLDVDDWGIADEINGTGNARFMIQRDTGYVGIWTGSPTSSLDVNGKIRWTATYAYDSSEGIWSTASTSSVWTTPNLWTSIDVQNGDIVKVTLSCNLSNSITEITYMRADMYNWVADVLMSWNWITVHWVNWSWGSSTALFQATADGTLYFAWYWHVWWGTGNYVYCNIDAIVIWR